MANKKTCKHDRAWWLEDVRWCYQCGAICALTEGNHNGQKTIKMAWPWFVPSGINGKNPIHEWIKMRESLKQ